AADLAKKRGLDAKFLERWIEVLAVEPFVKNTLQETESRRGIPAVTLSLLEETFPIDPTIKISGWKEKSAALPSLTTNASEPLQNLPAAWPPHTGAAPPTPTQFPAAAWKSPIAGQVRVSARIAHAHPACGNGVAFWVEHRQGDQAFAIAEGAVELGK